VKAVVAVMTVEVVVIRESEVDPSTLLGIVLCLLFISLLRVFCGGVFACCGRCVVGGKLIACRTAVRLCARGA